MIPSVFKNPCNYYFSLWSLYLLQGTLYTSGSLLSQVLLAIILLLSIKHLWILVRKKNKPVYLIGLTLLLVLFVVYGLIHIMFNGQYSPSISSIRPLTSSYLKTYLISILPIFSCYYYAIKKHLNEKMFQYWIIIFVIVAIAEYFRLQREVLSSLVEDREDITNNMGYIFLALFPCMMVYEKKPLFQYLGVTICTIFVILAVKRGAMLLMGVSIILFALYKMRVSKGIHRYLVILIIAVGLFYLYRFVEYRMANNQYFSQRIEETLGGDYSGRDHLYSDIIEAFITNSNAYQFFFGRGADGTLRITSNFAHNDWLEILTNQGVLGVVVFIIYWFLFYRTIKRYPYSRESRFTLILLLTVLGLKTLFSMSIGGMTIFTASILGYALSDGFREIG